MTLQDWNEIVHEFYKEIQEADISKQKAKNLDLALDLIDRKVLEKMRNK